MCLRNIKFFKHMSLPMYQHKMDLIPKRKKNSSTFLLKKKKKEMTAKSLKKRIINFSMMTILQMWAVTSKEAH